LGDLRGLGPQPLMASGTRTSQGAVSSAVSSRPTRWTCTGLWSCPFQPGQAHPPPGRDPKGLAHGWNPPKGPVSATARDGPLLPCNLGGSGGPMVASLGLSRLQKEPLFFKAGWRRLSLLPQWWMPRWHLVTLTEARACCGKGVISFMLGRLQLPFQGPKLCPKAKLFASSCKQHPQVP
jgi:hypothetical protein